MIKLYAQPFDCTATGFFFSSGADYREKAANNRKSCGQLVEEYEIQFIDGEAIDAALADALGLSQANHERFFEIVEDWSSDQKLRFILAVGEAFHAFDIYSDDPDDLDIDIYFLSSLRELAEEFVDEGLFGDIPDRIALYLDYDAIARDLSADYTETQVAGVPLIYRC